MHNLHAMSALMLSKLNLFLLGPAAVDLSDIQFWAHESTKWPNVKSASDLGGPQFIFSPFFPLILGEAVASRA